MKDFGKIGLALSGGAAKGLSHIGVLQAIEEYKLPIDIVSGTSMGAIVGVLYCAGLSADDILDLLRKEKVWNWFKINLFKSGIVNLKGVKEKLLHFIGHSEFEKLEKNFMVAVSNLNLGKAKMISEGNQLLDWVIASASIPVIFAPVEINGICYVDGGLFMNLPSNPLVLNCDTVIGSNAVAHNKIESITSTRKVAERVFNLSIVQNVRLSKSYCDYFIEPTSLNKYSMWDFKKIDEIVEMGYNAAKQTIINEILPTYESYKLKQ